MYFSIFNSYDYYSDEDTVRDIQTCDDEEDMCLICWLPGNNKNEIHVLTNFSNIKPKCRCNPKLHTACINEWVKKSPTCPICRTKMNIIIFTSDGQNVFINCYTKCVSYTVRFLRFIFYVSFFNLFFIIFTYTYTIFIYYIANKYYEDDSGIY
jgi:hypothetical protein